MPTPSQTKQPFSIATLAFVLSHPARWTILSKLAEGEPMMVDHLANLCGCSSNMMSKQMATLKRFGLVETGAGNLYRLTAAVRPGQNAGELDFGYCVLRADQIISAPRR